MKTKTVRLFTLKKGTSDTYVINPKVEAEAKRIWENYVASGNKPANIPAHPDKVYKKDWKGWVDWIGGLK